MPLAFLAPAFLLALAAIVGPIVVHLRQRERREPVRCPSLMFLRAIAHRSIERRRITNPWLLLLRVLALTALVIAFSRPFLRSPPNRTVVARGRRTVIVALDRSMSMSYRGVWARARDSALAALNGLAAGDRAALVTFDEGAAIAVPITQDLAAVRREIAALAPGGRGTRLASGLRAARELAAAVEGAPAEVVVISDFHRSALDGLESVPSAPGGTLRMVAVGAAEPGNARVASVDVDRRDEAGKARVSVVATIAGAGVAHDTRATLIVGNRPMGSVAAKIPRNGSVSVRFDPIIMPAGDAVAEVAIVPDDLAADDTLRFAIPAGAGTPVLLLDPTADPEQSLYLERALEISKTPAFAVAVSRSGLPAAAQLARTRVVVATSLAGLGAGGFAALERFVADGGGLVAMVGGPGAGASWLPASLGAAVERDPSSAAHLSALDGNHPILEPFKDALATDFGSARFFRYRDLKPDTAAAVVARFDDGRPAIVEGRHGKGRVILVAASLDIRSGDLPLQPVFLPLVHRLVAQAGSLEAARRWFDVGDAVAVPDARGDLAVRGPTSKGTAVRSGEAFVLDGPGVFEAMTNLSAAPIARWVVNPSPRESDLTPVDPREVLGQIRAPIDSTVRQPEAIAATVDERNQSWWMILLAAAMLVLVLETIQVVRIEKSRPRAGGAQ